jgi:hypothetical protein
MPTTSGKLAHDVGNDADDGGNDADDIVIEDDVMGNDDAVLGKHHHVRVGLDAEIRTLAARHAPHVRMALAAKRTTTVFLDLTGRGSVASPRRSPPRPIDALPFSCESANREQR